MIEITDSQARLIRDCVTDLVLHRQRYGQPIPSRVHDLLRVLSSPSYGSDDGTPVSVVPAQSTPQDHDDDQIGSTETAAILGCSDRRVRAMGHRLGGRKPNGYWVFSRQNVTEYADARRHG